MAVSRGAAPAARHHKLNTKTGNTTVMEHKRMTDCRDRHRDVRNVAHGRPVALARLAFVGGVVAILGGCATGATSSAFVDPAKYDLYNCKQLGTARRTTNDRVVELEGLMAKAETGAAGSLVSGLAYQTEYLSARGQRDLVDEKINSNHCTSADLAAPPPAPEAPSVKKRRH